MSNDSANVVITNSQGEFLLHLRDYKAGICAPGTWATVGGMREPGESPEENAYRELVEESGLDLSLTALGTFERNGAEVAVFHTHWDGDADALEVTEGIMFRWFNARQLHMLNISDFAQKCLHLFDPSLQLAERHQEEAGGLIDVWKTIGRLNERLERHSGLPREQRVLMQIIKLQEELGEVAEAVVGVCGQNPRKGFSHTWDDVEAEVCDVITTAMVALERLTPAEAQSRFDQHLKKIASRDLEPTD
ncbi:NUDIX domain-containing protein [Streptomyces broussonetiae]|uniref:NUDIX domain-containing protein n=1 Tax=Streptomyces broussonetiae TaxID=2686304 RepID=A0A6I6N0W7_9ACTN|nr:NUDIX domain-containing protein [Streptomyces broussonetiae]QHA02455.1 NUDIX domain-containing protein [Streptomyces broussonetiae]